MSVRRLIVNADDFGHAAGVNEGIIEAHVDGILTSTSLMVDMRAAAHAVGSAREHPRLSVGLHYVEDGPEIDEPGHAARTFAAQLERFRELTGSDPTHVDSHHHVHMSRMSTFAPLVEPLGVPLRGDGRVRYVGDFYAQPRRGVVELDRVRAPYLLELLVGQTDRQGRVHRARLPSGTGDRRPRVELRTRARGRARDPHRAGPAGADRGARARARRATTTGAQ